MPTVVPARVIDVHGRPIAGARIIQSSPRWDGPPAESLTDAAGRFELLAVAAGESHTLEIVHTRYVRARIDAWSATEPEA